MHRHLKKLLSLSCWKMLAWGLLKGPPSLDAKGSRRLSTQQCYGVSCSDFPIILFGSLCFSAGMSQVKEWKKLSLSHGLVHLRKSLTTTCKCLK